MNVVFNIPHFVEQRDFSNWTNPENIANESNLWTDFKTDLIFHDLKNRFYEHKASYSRFIVDTERLVNDPLEEIGQGIIYLRSKNGLSKRTITEDEKVILFDYYTKYHQELYSKTSDPNTLLIDCHSYPNEFDSNYDICIGFNEDASKPDGALLSYVIEHFKRYNYTIGINQPFSNSIVGKPETPSLMIELNKRIYWNREKHCLNGGANRIVKCLNELYDYLFEL